MNTDSSTNSQTTTENLSPQPVPERPKLQIRLKPEGGVMKLILPTEAQMPVGSNWNDLWEQLQQRLQGTKRFWQPLMTVHLIAHDRLLDARQLQAIADSLAEVHLQLQLVTTSRRQTAVAAATAGYSIDQNPVIPPPIDDDKPPMEPLVEPLYLQMTVRSGIDIRHNGTVIVMGDVNPGGEIYAGGDILVWGKLKGIAHAGYPNNPQCLIMALQMEPTQLRIANYVARSPEQPPAQFEPEIAYVTPDGIRIARSADVRLTPHLRDLAMSPNLRSP
jgi:septum site-determining protein MinC